MFNHVLKETARRKAETLRRALELELDFYGRVFGFTAPGLSERVEIANMPAGEG
jgi:hypothetical protein